MAETVIGTVTVPEQVEYVDRTLQTASWYDTYQIQPGTYDAVRVTDHHIRVRFDAVLTYRYRVGTLLGYSQVSPDSGERNEPATVVLHFYDYEFAGMALPNNVHRAPFNATVEIRAPYAARERRITSDYDGREIVTARLVKV